MTVQEVSRCASLVRCDLQLVCLDFFVRDLIGGIFNRCLYKANITVQSFQAFVVCAFNFEAKVCASWSCKVFEDKQLKRFHIQAGVQSSCLLLKLLCNLKRVCVT